MARQKTARDKATDDDRPISDAEVERLFSPLSDAPALVLAVSGGPDSMALMWLAARWRDQRAQGPRLIAVTVDHGLRREAAREAREVKRVARTLDLPHRTLRWRGDKPASGVPEAARAARYRLLVQAARSAGASHIVTAHTRDDQAETLLMRLLRGSGIAGLAAMSAISEREGLALARPLLGISKAQLIATLQAAEIKFIEDPTNVDPAFTRPRLRALMPALAAEGGDARNLARLAARFARANAAIEVLADGAERYLALTSRMNSGASGGQRKQPARGQVFDLRAFAALPEEIRLRLLIRTVDRFGTEGPVELGKAEALLTRLDRAFAEFAGGGEATRDRLKSTLAGALVSVANGQIRFEPAPARRARSG
ncbi:tRNA(Ile)-lysidine synthase (tRNA(Ile)-lysidine synthetase) (tRNA(Ile)-2-lysyl-cytidine synthase) [Bradyrhizobium sp. STM 3843]|uniref:tRNA lysidine(34) synthetase TilS n=1 Tax=Bradyrhizobium sp. STM 3843 TaxID=551947 RepID=UPI00024043E3|nr:tRNA lysidine(34) synthetase TilS [Bradyrhizobium sp. STM 3843]CCE11641.1 tRNA(Ile)-lysidine synthase (tRNA(Ile)-lysidine synthetase) (tRNA(Ile)-2-lysyl-cytidine synthase) [Bradyrhizobium sp. STM 3843]